MFNVVSGRHSPIKQYICRNCLRKRCPRTPSRSLLSEPPSSRRDTLIRSRRRTSRQYISPCMKDLASRWTATPTTQRSTIRFWRVPISHHLNGIGRLHPKGLLRSGAVTRTAVDTQEVRNAPPSQGNPAAPPFTEATCSHHRRIERQMANRRNTGGNRNNGSNDLRQYQSCLQCGL